MNAIILLHEIYGRNDFMNMLCRKYRDLGFRVYCPDLNRGRVFDYRETEAAYAHFYANRDACRSVWALLDRLKPRYENVFLVGYSAGRRWTGGAARIRIVPGWWPAMAHESGTI